MAVERTDYSIIYEIDAPDQTTFGFPFSAGSIADIHVFDHDTELPEGDPARTVEIPQSGFSIIANPTGLDSGGNVILAASPAIGHMFEIRRITIKTQTSLRLNNQAVIPPKSLEKALDKLTRIDQELHGRLESLAGGLGGLRIAIEEEVVTRTAADDALDKRIDKEIQDREDAVKEERDARKEKDDDLQKQIQELADKGVDDDALKALQEKVGALETGKMPKAPDDGKMYVGVGGTWKELNYTPGEPTDPVDPPPSTDSGDPFVKDEDGDVVIVERGSYLPNSVWDIRPNELVLSESSQPGDEDSLWLIDADGDAALKE